MKTKNKQRHIYIYIYIYIYSLQLHLAGKIYFRLIQQQKVDKYHCKLTYIYMLFTIIYQRRGKHKLYLPFMKFTAKQLGFIIHPNIQRNYNCQIFESKRAQAVAMICRHGRCVQEMANPYKNRNVVCETSRRTKSNVVRCESTFETTHLCMAHEFCE
jgi:hypothetical protein